METFDINAFLEDANQAEVTVNEETRTSSHGFLKFIGGLVVGVVATKLVDFALKTRRQWVEDHLDEIRRRLENGETPEEIAASESEIEEVIVEDDED